MKYEHYSESEYDWMPSLPSHWDVQRLKYVLNMHYGGCWGNDAAGDSNDRLCIRVADFDYDNIMVRSTAKTRRNYTDQQIERGQLKKGDLILEKSGGGEKTPVGRVVRFSNYDNQSVMFANFSECLRPDSQSINSDYLAFYLKAFYATSNMKRFYKQTTGIQNVDMSAYMRIGVPIPPAEEQEQIVNYLNWKLSSINKLVAIKHKEIRLLRERREAEINEAVTHGVRKQSLKPSGLNWLPFIPEGWETIPAKVLFSHITEVRHQNDEMLAATQKYGMIPQKKYMELEGRRIVLANDNLDKWIHVEPNDFVISLRSFQGGLELSTIPGCVTWHYVVLRPNEGVYVPYYRWLFKSASYIGALQRTSDFIRDGQDLRFSNFVKVRLMAIPLDEQKQIADYLEQTIPKFDDMERKLQAQIELLQEMKDKIITDVVTGQEDVRYIVIPDCTYSIDSDDTDIDYEEDIDENAEEE